MSGAVLDDVAIAPVHARACSRLEELRWLGVTDTLDRDLETLASTFGWPPLGPAPRSNPTAPEHRLRAADLSPALHSALRARLAPDYDLLGKAREIAAARWAVLR